MIKTILRTFVINVFALWLASTYIGGFHVADGWRSLLIVGVGFTLVHTLIKPLLSVVLGPLNFITLGLVGALIDAGLLFGMTMYFPQISISAWIFPGLVTPYLAIPAIELNLVSSTIFSAIFIDVIRSILSTLLG